MLGININCKHQDFIAQILSGEKIIETRNTPSLNPYIGQKIGLIRTGQGKATLEGYAQLKAQYCIRILFVSTSIMIYIGLILIHPITLKIMGLKLVTC